MVATSVLLVEPSVKCCVCVCDSNKGRDAALDAQAQKFGWYLNVKVRAWADLMSAC